MTEYKVIASPQPGPQTAFVECPIFEIFYGGARGGGKTMAVLLKWAVHSAGYAQATGLIVRRERTHLIDMINEAHKLFSPLGAKWREQAKEYVMPNGAILRFAYLESDKDAEAYQGHNLSFVGVEEITQFPDPAPINKLKATLRNGPNPQFVATGNPGGPGHHWVKARYIDPAPKGFKTITEEFKNPFTGEITKKCRVFIPSKIKDNHFLGADYVATLQQSGSPQLVKAWLEGDWNVIEGAYFPEFCDRHIVQPFEIPTWWTRYRAFDWGSYRPFCSLWIAVSDGDNLTYPRGALIVYREYYGSSAPNIGLKLTADEVADGIRLREHKDEKITFSVGDPSMFKVDGGPSIAEKMAQRGVIFMPADNSRITGWNEVRRRLKGDELDKGIYDAPTLYIFSTCVNLIRTLPLAQHDDHKPEDIDTDGEDHPLDTLRYGCMARYGVQDRPLDLGSQYLASNVFKVRKKNTRI